MFCASILTHQGTIIHTLGHCEAFSDLELRTHLWKSGVCTDVCKYVGCAAQKLDIMGPVLPQPSQDNLYSQRCPGWSGDKTVWPPLTPSLQRLPKCLLHGCRIGIGGKAWQRPGSPVSGVSMPHMGGTSGHFRSTCQLSIHLSILQIFWGHLLGTRSQTVLGTQS